MGRDKKPHWLRDTSVTAMMREGLKSPCEHLVWAGYRFKYDPTSGKIEMLLDGARIDAGLAIWVDSGGRELGAELNEIGSAIADFLNRVD